MGRWMHDVRGAFHRLLAEVAQSRRRRSTADLAPWEHPYLTTFNLRRFRDYSRQLAQIAREHEQRAAAPLRIAFCVNMAQSMCKWARMAQAAGASVAVYPHPMDTSALSAPEWEVFDGDAS